MRKVKFRTLLVMGFAAFLLLFAGADRVQAQGALTTSLYSTPSGNWVSSAEAENLLLAKINQLSGLLQTLTPGTQAHKATLRAGVYYKTIHREVKIGKQIPDSIVTGLGIFASSVYGDAPQSEQYGLRNEAIGMLSQ